MSTPRRPAGTSVGLARWGIAFAAAWSIAGASPAGEAVPASDDPRLEARVAALGAELRCLVCQNQTLADSQSALAEDLRAQIRSQLAAGATEDQVRQYMTARYGDFVLYRPPFKATTALLWAGPGLLLATGLGVLVTVLRRRQRMAAELFDPSPEDGDESDDR